MTVNVRRLYVSPRHNYFGHHSLPPGEHPILEVPEIKCVAGRGIQGDRFFDYKVNYKGQITFFRSKFMQRFAENLICPAILRRGIGATSLPRVSI